MTQLYVMLTVLMTCLVPGGSSAVETSPATNQSCRNVVYNVQSLHQPCCSNQSQENSRAAIKDLRTQFAALQTKLHALESSPSVKKDVTDKLCLHHASSPKTIQTLPKDCSDIYDHGHRLSGVYWIQPHGSSNPFQVYCEMNIVEGWTVIMSRFNGAVDFYRNWTEYKHGFGSAADEHWIGNDHISQITAIRNYKLRVEFTYWTGGNSYTADYARFKVDPETNKYKLQVTGYSGNSGKDGMAHVNGRYFTTIDKDNDQKSGKNCASERIGGFWYNSCTNAQPTSPYLYSTDSSKTMRWHDDGTTCKTMIMKIAPNV